MGNLTEEQFSQLVAHAPLVSIDLRIRNAAGEVLLGFRVNRPAKDYWFVPGRRIHKGETITQALVETIKTELDRSVDLQAVHLVGVFDHFYPETFASDSGDGTHYVVLLYEVEIEVDIKTLPRKQHSEWRWMALDELRVSNRVHENVKKFFSDGEAHISTKELLQLYPVHQTAISSYNNIVWAFPAAFVAMNALSIEKLSNNPLPLLLLAIFNFLLVQAFFKLVANQRAIVQPQQRLESLLRRRFSVNDGSSLVPDFPRQYNYFTKLKSAFWIEYALLVLTILNLVWAIKRCSGTSSCLWSAVKTFVKTFFS